MRTLEVSEVTKAVKELCIKANHKLAPDMEKALLDAGNREESELGKKILGPLKENLDIA